MSKFLKKCATLFSGFTTFSAVLLRFGEDIFKFNSVVSLNRDWAAVSKDITKAMKKFEAQHERKKSL